MKKLIILIALGLILSIQPVEVFAKTICFAGPGGTFWYFSGGKPDQKPFSGYVLDPGFPDCIVPAWASIIIDSIGNTYLSTNSLHGPSAPCDVSVWITVSGATTAVLSGFVDTYQDGTFDLPITMTEVNCNSIPTAKPQKDRPKDAVAVSEKSDK